MTATPSLAERKAAVLASLHEGRDLLASVLGDVRQDEIYGASQWGVADALNHMIGDPPYYAMVQRTLAEDRPQFPAWSTPDEDWARLKTAMLDSADKTIAWVESLSPEQLQRVAICGTDEVPVIQFLEWAAGHYLEHGLQIRDEILPLVRGGATPTT